MRHFLDIFQACVEQPTHCESPRKLEEALVPEAWDPKRFHHVSVLQEAVRNHGRIEVAEDRKLNRLVAVKAMPLWWARSSHREFVAAHPKENEYPWLDMAMTVYLRNVANIASVCEFLGVFLRDTEARGPEICFVLTYCAGGDLLSWLGQSLRTKSLDREALSRPIVLETFKTVHRLHRLGIAHGDLSLENVLLQGCSGEVRLIDFGASTGPRATGSRGKPSYQAPECHSRKEYDAMAADSFSLGVLLFTLVTGNYPWRSTQGQACQCFHYFTRRGLTAYLAARTLDRGTGKALPLLNIMSGNVVSLLEGLLNPDPASRLTVAAALDHPWFLGNGSDKGCTRLLPPQQPVGCWHGILLSLWNHAMAAEKIGLWAAALGQFPTDGD
mmetsp:Transcript_7301/g.18249  ORF Transcript_7301/g.18249 Transcript_7301/m.18249 type:complete len:385 (-) Transcript_7301:174-1328(-)|eukprot:CAMPEP_0115188706 /NCGR_PEP_ID=MMETSP0270-20121206/11147_1 /TAXON_ID=71861 /ORGANISM="Scrippsiella trochoidea, Strain CCMP3099" /LENGTH=384 /DNA_ID=CAMNT_0002601893 /DNA_START=171 /DNA_END=1325 /DNA_ORIENTATION=-